MITRSEQCLIILNRNRLRDGIRSNTATVKTKYFSPLVLVSILLEFGVAISVNVFVINFVCAADSMLTGKLQRASDSYGLAAQPAFVELYVLPCPFFIITIVTLCKMSSLIGIVVCHYFPVFRLYLARSLYPTDT